MSGVCLTILSFILCDSDCIIPSLSRIPMSAGSSSVGKEDLTPGCIVASGSGVEMVVAGACGGERSMVETGNTGSWLMDASERGSDSLSEQESLPDNKTGSC